MTTIRSIEYQVRLVFKVQLILVLFFLKMFVVVVKQSYIVLAEILKEQGAQHRQRVFALVLTVKVRL